MNTSQSDVMAQIVYRKMAGVDALLAEAKTPRLKAVEWLPILFLAIVFCALGLLVWLDVFGAKQSLVAAGLLGGAVFIGHIMTLYTRIALLNRRVDALIEYISKKD